jgi:EmrB/QacA subfamily drug resistance transporter
MSAIDRTDHAARTWVLALTSVASLMVALDALVMSTAMTAIGAEFSASIEALEWTISAYLLPFAVFLIAASGLGDRFGRRRIFVCGLMLFAAASAACALAPGIGWLIAARAAQGTAAAMVMPLALTQLSAAFPPERRGWALGIYSGVTALSTVIGPLIGGIITQGVAWQWIFWLNVPVGAAVTILTLVRIRATVGPRAPLDVGGVVLATAASFGLVWGLVRANPAGWSSAEVLAALAGGGALAVAFVAWELCSAAPMVPMRLFRDRTFAASNAAMFLLNGALISVLFFIAQFEQVALGQDALSAGLRILPWGAAITLMAPKAGMVAGRLGERAAIVLGLTLQAAGLAWLGMIARPDLPVAPTLLPMIAAGAGFALAVPIVQKGALGAVAPADIGKASGTLSMLRQLGGAFGVALCVAVFGRFGDRSTPQAFCDGFAAASGVAAMLSLAGALAACCLPSTAGAQLYKLAKPDNA